MVYNVQISKSPCRQNLRKSAAHPDTILKFDPANLEGLEERWNTLIVRGGASRRILRRREVWDAWSGSVGTDVTGHAL